MRGSFTLNGCMEKMLMCSGQMLLFLSHVVCVCECVPCVCADCNAGRTVRRTQRHFLVKVKGVCCMKCTVKRKRDVDSYYDTLQTLQSGVHIDQQLFALYSVCLMHLLFTLKLFIYRLQVIDTILRSCDILLLKAICSICVIDILHKIVGIFMITPFYRVSCSSLHSAAIN